MGRSSWLAGASAARSSDGSAKGKSKLGIRTKNAGILSPRVDVDKCNNKDGGTDAPAAAAAQVEKKVIRVTLPDGSTKAFYAAVDATCDEILELLKGRIAHPGMLKLWHKYCLSKVKQTHTHKQGLMDFFSPC